VEKPQLGTELFSGNRGASNCQLRVKRSAQADGQKFILDLQGTEKKRGTRKEEKNSLKQTERELERFPRGGRGGRCTKVQLNWSTTVRFLGTRWKLRDGERSQKVGHSRKCGGKQKKKQNANNR